MHVTPDATPVLFLCALGDGVAVARTHMLGTSFDVGRGSLHHSLRSPMQDAEKVIGNSGNYSAALNLIRTASCNCYSFEPFVDDSIERKMSLITQNMNLADPCTFRIVVKNVTVLMDDTDPLKIATKDCLAQLVRSFELLDDLVYSAGEVDSETRERVVPAISRTIELEQQLREKIVLCIAREV
jgi:hypothetical protein